MSLDFQSVTMTDVSRHFGRRRALARISLALQQGDILGLLGPNGSGKSTLIGILSTLITPSSGTVRYGNGSAASNGSDLRRRIGLLAHELHLYPELSARQNLEFYARMYDLDPRVASDAALEAAGLSQRADDQISTFSRGMRQRVAFERALLHQPRLVLLDEPFTGLDDAATEFLSDRIRSLSTAGSIVVVATHDLEIAERLVTRVAIVRNGQIVCDEPSAGGLRHRYRGLVGAA